METSMGQVVSKVDEVLKRLEGHEDDGSKSRGGSASSSRTGSGISRGMRDIASAKGEFRKSAICLKKIITAGDHSSL